MTTLEIKVYGNWKFKSKTTTKNPNKQKRTPHPQIKQTNNFPTSRFQLLAIQFFKDLGHMIACTVTQNDKMKSDG